MTLFSASVACNEVHGSRREDFAWGAGPSASVQLECAYADRWDLVADIVGTRRFWPDFPLAGIPPWATRAVIAVDASKAVTSGQSLVYPVALVTVSYNYGDDPEGGGGGGEDDSAELIAEQLEPSAEFITLDYRRFKWGSRTGDPLTEGEAPGKLQRGLTLVRKWFKVPGPLPASLLTCVGCVNGSEYASDVLGLTFAPETLMFCPPSTDHSITTTSFGDFDVTTKFMYKPDGWNKFWRAKTQAFEEIWDPVGGDDITVGAAYKNFPTASFAAFLF